MSDVTPVSTNTVINWQFKVVEQGFISRYGMSAGSYYKQYLPGGIEAPHQHPPKRIGQLVYDLAHRQYVLTLEKNASG